MQQQQKRSRKAANKQMILQQQMKLVREVLRESTEMVAVTSAKLLRPYRRTTMTMRKKIVRKVKPKLVKRMTVRKKIMNERIPTLTVPLPEEVCDREQLQLSNDKP